MVPTSVWPDLHPVGVGIQVSSTRRTHLCQCHAVSEQLPDAGQAPTEGGLQLHEDGTETLSAATLYAHSAAQEKANQLSREVKAGNAAISPGTLSEPKEAEAPERSGRR